MHRKFIGKEIQMANNWKDAQALWQSNVRWPYTLARLPAFPLPPSRTHSACPNKTRHRGMKECGRVMRSHTLLSFDFLPPSLWLFHRILFAHRSWHRCVDSEQISSQGTTYGEQTECLGSGWVLIVLGLLTTRQTRGLSQAPPPFAPLPPWGNRGACTHWKGRGAHLRGCSSEKNGVSQGCHLWVEWVCASLLEDQTGESMESILGINLEKTRTDSINQKRKKKKKKRKRESGRDCGREEGSHS